jgi:hypothetical protein
MHVPTDFDPGTRQLAGSDFGFRTSFGLRAIRPSDFPPPEGRGGPWGCTPATPATNRINIGYFALLDPLHTDKHWSQPLFLDRNVQYH